MIKLNEKYYNGICPQYEIEYLVKIGLDRNLIINKLEENNINISKEYTLWESKK